MKEVEKDFMWSGEKQTLTKAPRTGKTINELIAKEHVEYPDDPSHSVGEGTHGPIVTRTGGMGDRGQAGKERKTSTEVAEDVARPLM
jgi:hypothetical protein